MYRYDRDVLTTGPDKRAHAVDGFHLSHLQVAILGTAVIVFSPEVHLQQALKDESDRVMRELARTSKFCETVLEFLKICNQNLAHHFIPILLCDCMLDRFFEIFQVITCFTL